MRVLIISDLESKGGAAIAAQRLAQGLSGLGVQCLRAVGAMDGGDTTQEKVLLSPGKRLEGIAGFIESLGQRKLAERITHFGVQRQLPLLIERFKPDCISIHNLHKAKWDIDLVEECARHAPVVWTLHDMWSMTGRCAHSCACDKFITGCDAACPTPREYPEMEPHLIAGAWAAKKSVLEKHSNIAAVCPSEWLAAKARKGIWQGHTVEAIPNGLDLGVFYRRDSRACRSALGLQQDIPTIVLVADYLSIKGGGLLSGILAAAKSRPLQILTMGNCPPEIDAEGVCHTHFGYVASDIMKTMIYSASDLNLHLAFVDNLPNTVAEAIACGTPVVAYATGGVPEMVRDGCTGWLVERFEPACYAVALDKAVEAVRNGTSPTQTCRPFAEEHYGLEGQAARYMRLFETMCATGLTAS